VSKAPDLVYTPRRILSFVQTASPMGESRMELSSQAKYRLALATFFIFAFLTVADVFALLHSPPRWLSNWPHWAWQDWTSFSSDLFFPIMALVSFADLRKRSQG
jgi:hypothetical protein